MKPTLVGESNPYGGDDYYALYPAPAGCAGHRLCCLVLGMCRADYLEAFERVNLVRGKWSVRAAREAAAGLAAAGLAAGPGLKLVLLGAKVSAAFGVPFRPFEAAGETMLCLPHPSGLNRMWAEGGTFERARGAVAAFLPGVAHLLGRSPREG